LDEPISEPRRGKNLLGVSGNGEDLELRVLGKLTKSYLGSEAEKLWDGKSTDFLASEYGMLRVEASDRVILCLTM